MRMTRTRDMMSRRMRDRRNPYGSRGGYVVSDKRGRDYGRMGDYASDREYRTEYPDMAYSRTRMERNRDYGERDYEYGRDYGSDVRRIGNFEYDTYYGDGRDYASGDYRLTTKEMREWERELENSDGSHGAKFNKEQIMQVAQSMGIRYDEFSPELLATMTNVMYSDYGAVCGTQDIAHYIKMAKAFLCDDDFDGTPEEKAYLYYTAIVEQE